MTDMSSRVDALEAHIANGTLLRGGWTDGHAHACLLAALSPEAGERRDPVACPASVMPAWLAHMTPAMDDNGSLKRWPAMVRRYAGLARRWHALDAAAWARCEARCKLASLAVASGRAGERGRSEVATVVALLERRIAGDEPSADEWRAARASAARASAWAAAASAAEAAWAAAEAAAAWAEAAARAAAWAASAASAAAEEAAWAAARAARTRWGEREAWDRIADSTLDAIEAECVAAESEAAP